MIWKCQNVDAVLVLISLHYMTFGGTCQVKISCYRAVLNCLTSHTYSKVCAINRGRLPFRCWHKFDGLPPKCLIASRCEWNTCPVSLHRIFVAWLMMPCIPAVILACASGVRVWLLSSLYFSRSARNPLMLRTPSWVSSVARALLSNMVILRFKNILSVKCVKILDARIL